jgi:PII-like signaling protein
MEAAMTRLTGSALRVTIFIGENDTWHHKPLYAEIVHRAHAAGLAGASVFRGIEGFGASSLIHTSRLLSLSEDLPVAVIVVDTEERVRAFLPQLDELVTEGLVILDDCEVIRHVGRDRTPEGSSDTSGATGGDLPGKGEKSS